MISCLECAKACCAKHRNSSLLFAKPEPRPPKENAALAMTGYSRYSAASKACQQIYEMVTYGLFTQLISCQPFATENYVHSQASKRGICDGQNVTGTGFTPSTSGSPCQYRFTNAPYSISHLLPMPYNLSS
jgi:hypothetical protein